MKKILLIGGCGYIGSALYQYLLDKYYTITTVDLEWFGNVNNPNNLRLDFAHLTSEFIEKFDVVILLAAHSSVPMANLSAPRATFANNVSRFVDLLPKIPVGVKFIYMGSSSVYNGMWGLANETMTLNPPANIYDATKQHIDQYIQYDAPNEWYGLRLGTVNGTSPNLRTDIMINSMVEAVRTKGHIKVFNPDLNRPILGMYDLCRAIHTIIEHNKNASGIYNLASFNATVREIAMGVSITMNTSSSYELAPPSAVAPYDFAINSNLFRDTFGFTFMNTVESITRELMDGSNLKYAPLRRGTRNMAVNNV